MEEDAGPPWRRTGFLALLRRGPIPPRTAFVRELMAGQISPEEFGQTLQGY
ncbi:hypothetical protein B7755_014915 [Streptomyces sp. NBS 14/10]|uniref:hypothetical protein n=1 Tax=Streptomyces sp. NBS 14/10 TaxID=1945643 RepID=UPI0015C672E0|nr:hypothetical protein [Streptomyces sp. NBS 14/10]KAK1186542.1 hypothetical protein B7755_014915 [Streptomyces sp. NBS 14/10]